MQTGPSPQGAGLMATPWMIFFSFFSSCGVFAFLLFHLTRQRELVPAAVALSEPPALPLLIAAAGAFLASLILPKILLKSAAAKNGKETGMGDAEVVTINFLPFVISLALAEVPAVLGFLVGNAAPSLEAAVPFFVLSAAGLAIHTPSLEKWRRRVQAAQARA